MRVYLGNLGCIQLTLCMRVGLTDFDDCISNLQKAVQLTKEGDPNRLIYLGNLGCSQLGRYECHDILTNLEDGISNLQRAVQLNEDAHPTKALWFFNLGHGYRKRFKCHGQLPDLENAISHFEKAVQLTEDGHPKNSIYLFNLGLSQQSRFEWLDEPVDGAASIAAFRAVALSKTAYNRDSFRAAKKWADILHGNGDLLSALNAYRIALEILPKVAWLGLGPVGRQCQLFQADPERLSCLSATCAIRLGRLEEAVELLDIGHSVFWQQVSSLRTDLEILREAAPELANQFERVGRTLEADSFSGSLRVAEQRVGIHTEDVAKERRRLVGEWEGLLERVRQLPGFKYFLKPVSFRQLQQAATGGQVVIINVSKYGVDALFFDATHQIEHVPLPEVDIETLSELAGDIVTQRPIKPSDSQTKRYNSRYLQPALRRVWKDILVPIFDKIQAHSNDTSSAPEHRIWWYLTGPLTFIPIHAAGPGKGKNDVSRMVISSYVTTLSSLLKAQKQSQQRITGRLKLLVVSQTDTPGQGLLPLAVEELEKVTQVVHSAGWPHEDIVCLSGSEATVDCVSGTLESSAWVHLACHAMQHATSDMGSGFALHDGHLELSEIAYKRLSTGQFAFLSACNTAAVPAGLPGEAMHVTAGLQFAGFPSVIATMWGISDQDALIVASHTYEYLFHKGVQFRDPAESATALNRAVLCLREDPNVTVDRWAPFIHFGV